MWKTNDTGRSRHRPIGFIFLVGLSVLSAGVAREVPLTVLVTTDMHGRVFPAEGKDRPYSILYAASVIEEIRRQSDNVLLFDCGDLIQGTAESFLSRGRIMIDAVEYLGYDAWVVGNHDFDWGVDVLSEIQASCKAPMLAANIVTMSGHSNRLWNVKPYILRDVEGIRVAIVGLTTPGIPRFSTPDLIEGLRFERSVDALARTLREVREHEPDVMILLAHQGFQRGGDDSANELFQVGNEFPEFDLMCGGHLHVVIPGMHIGSVLYVQAGHHAEAVTRVDLVYDTVERKVVARSACSIPVTWSAGPHTGLVEAVSKDLDKARRHLEEAVGEVAEPLTTQGGRYGESAMHGLFLNAIAGSAEADVVLHGILSDRELAAGPVTMRDVWEVVPYDNRIGVASLNLGELREILEENAGLLGSRYFMGVRGLRYELRPDAPAGSRVGDIRDADGRAINGRKRLRVAFNSYTLASAGERFLRLWEIVQHPNARLALYETTTRDAVRDHIRNHSPLRPETVKTVTVLR